MGRITGGSFQFNLHGITGALAIILMVFHAVWGTIVQLRKNPGALNNFHKLSVVVWAFWLILYVIGVTVGMGGRA